MPVQQGRIDRHIMLDRGLVDDRFDALKQIDPEVRVVLTSGYTQAEATRGFEGRGLAGFLPKPYDMDTLRTTVQQHLKHKEKI